MLKDRLTKLNLFNSGHIYLDQKPMTKFRVIWLYQEYTSHISLNKAEISLWLPEQKTASVGWNKVNGCLFMLWLTLAISKTFYRRLTSIYIFRCAVVWLYSLVLLHTFSNSLQIYYILLEECLDVIQTGCWHLPGSILLNIAMQKVDVFTRSARWHGGDETGVMLVLRGYWTCILGGIHQ